MSKVEVEGGLLDRWQLVLALLKDKRHEDRHTCVLACVLDAYFKRHGNARASVRFIAGEMSMSMRTVVRATQELVEWGYFTRVPGTGTRPSEFVPNWLSVSPGGNATSVSPGGNASVSPGGNANPSSVSPGGNESYLPSPLTGGRTGSRNPEGEGTHAPVSGSGAAAADAALAAPSPVAWDPNAQSGFDQLWQAWGKKVDRHKARQAYAKLNPDAELHAELVAQAAAWTNHYTIIGREKKYQTSLSNWLALEKYREDLPEAYTDAKEAAVARNRANGPKPRTTKPEAEPGKHGHNMPRGSRVMTITAAETMGSPFDIFTIGLTLTDNSGAEYRHEFTTNHPTDEALIDVGTQTVSRLCNALTGGMLSDTADWLDKQVLVTVKPSGAVEYSAAS